MTDQYKPLNSMDQVSEDKNDYRLFRSNFLPSSRNHSRKKSSLFQNDKFFENYLGSDK